MKEIYKQLFTRAFIVMSIFSSYEAMAQDELREDRSYSYALQENTYVEISNKYGDIEIATWDKDSVAIEVSLIVRSDRDIDLHEIMDRIEVNFKGNSSYVLAETNWSDDVGFFRKGVQNIKQGLKSNGNIEVNYIVHLPSNTELDIRNKFGNVFFGDFDGNLNMNIEYGDLRARKLSHVKKISLKYGKLKISEMDRGSLVLSAVKSAHIVQANDIMITSSSSEIEIDEIKTLNIDSKHDDLRIEYIDQLFGQSSLSDIKVSLIKEESRLQSKFGSIYFKEIESSASKINIDGDRTDIFMNFKPGFDGIFDIHVDEEKKLALTETMKINSREKSDVLGWNIKATEGSGEGTAVNIVSAKGYVQIGR
ncbi:MAG: hypothetical protein ACI8XB_002325 [Patiriisocius sp.]|jgi:hypothetical protein